MIEIGMFLTPRARSTWLNLWNTFGPPAASVSELCVLCDKCLGQTSTADFDATSPR
jgi:hypothetical protein